MPASLESKTVVASIIHAYKVVWLRSSCIGLIMVVITAVLLSLLLLLLLSPTQISQCWLQD